MLFVRLSTLAVASNAGACARGFLHLMAAALFLSAWAFAASPAGGITDSPLAEEAYPHDTLKFISLAPADTGVRAENRYDDPKISGELSQEFDSSSIGTGVAIGDYDGDGRPDIFVACKSGSCRLFRNLGGWKFEDTTEKAGVGEKEEARQIWKQGVAFVDVNNDGRLDIYVCRFDAPNLLYINQGDGTFKEEAGARGLAVKDSSVMASFCDYDRDGWLDVYITTNILNISLRPEGQRGYLFHNNRDGTFTDVSDRAGINGVGQSHSATWWDYDHDGWLDLYVGYDYGVPDQLYHNNRDGTFTNMIDLVLPHTAFSSMGADVGDVNNDGLIDFIVADMAATTHETDQRFLADARAKTEERSDGEVTIPKYHHNALLLATGTGHCLEAANLAGVAATDWTWSVRLEDLDNDGFLDLFATNGFHRSPSVDVIRRMTNATSAAERKQILSASPIQAEANIALRNLGDLHFENVGKAWGLDQKGVSFGAAFGDLDGDGDLDLVYTNYRGEPSVLRNESGPNHRITIDLRGTLSNRFGIDSVVTLETSRGVQVRTLTLARGYLSTSEPMIHFGLGDATRIRRLTVKWSSGHEQVFENLPVDRRFTITEPSTPRSLSFDAPQGPPGQFEEVGKTIGLRSEDLLAREESVDELTVQRLLPTRLNRRGPALAIGEPPGDGRPVLAIGGTALTPTRILIRRTDGTFEKIASSTNLPVDQLDDGPLLWFDADGDGRSDLFVTKGGNSLPANSKEYQPRLYLGTGDGDFKEAANGALPALLTSAGAVAAIDFDHDGRLDLFIGGRTVPGAYPTSPVSALWANRGGGRFEDVTARLAPQLRNVGMVTAALWSDVDGDGWPDLLLALEWGQVMYFHNHQGESFENWTERAGFASAGTGWWTSLATADFNGDGRPDFVVGNVGLNTQYHADASHPALLYVGDFSGQGSTQLLEGYYEGEKIFPWRTRHDLGAVFPALLKRYPKNSDFARATLGELFGEERLAKSTRWAATELRSGVLLSQADGFYRFEPLPRLAQIAPVQGVVAGDFDGDGHADIYVAQNSHAPIPAVGRFDGGISQLLRGDGGGHFLPVPPRESSLIVPGDAKAVIVTDLNDDGWPDFLVSQNNDTLLAFQNHGHAGHHPLRVTLQGPPENPGAIGARVTVELTDDSIQTAEVSVGSGYYSQSSTACFFGYPDSILPKKIRVRWPNGSITEHAIPKGVTLLNLQAPTS